MERKTTCPICKDLHDHCVVEETEVGGKLFKSYICFECGMTTNTHFALDSEHLEQATENNSQLMNDLKIIDEDRGLVWYPSVVNMGERGIIYPDGAITDWFWYYAKVVDVPEEEREKYDGMEKRLDIENPQKFGQFEFMDACRAMGIVVEAGDEIEGVSI